MPLSGIECYINELVQTVHEVPCVGSNTNYITSDDEKSMIRI